MIIDAHTHIDFLSGLLSAPLDFKKKRVALLAEMKANKVDAALVIANFDRTDPRMLTTAQAIRITEGTGNLYPIGSLDILKYTKADLAEHEKWMKTGKIRGIKIYLGYQHVYPTDPRCIPIYKLCMDSDLPVIFHTGDTLATERSAKVKYAHPLAIDDVATDFPRLKIVIAHLGNPWLVDCAEVLYRNRNVYADISGLFFDEGLNTPYGKITKNKIDELIAYSDPGKLLYGTDWPLAPMKDYLAFARGLAVPRTAQRKFFSGNAMQLFRIVV